MNIFLNVIATIIATILFTFIILCFLFLIRKLMGKVSNVFLLLSGIIGSFVSLIVALAITGFNLHWASWIVIILIFVSSVIKSKNYFFTAGVTLMTACMAYRFL